MRKHVPPIGTGEELQRRMAVLEREERTSEIMKGWGIVWKLLLLALPYFAGVLTGLVLANIIRGC